MRAIVVELQQSEEWGSPAQQRLSALKPDAAPELIRLIPRIEKPHALRLTGMKLAELGSQEAIPALIATLSRRYPGTHPSAHPAFDPLQAFSWKAVGPLTRAMDSPDFGTQYFAAKLLADRCMYAPEDKRLLPAMLRLTKSRIPDLEVIGESGLYYLAFFVTGGWMGEVPIVIELENREALTGMIDLLLTGSHDARKSTSSHLLFFLEHMKTEGAIPERKQLGQESWSLLLASHDAYLHNAVPEVRMASLALLAYHEKTGMPHVAALGDDEELVRQTAARTLIAQFNPAWLPEVEKHLKSSNPAVRAVAVKVMGWSFQPTAVAALRECLKDENEGVRKAAQAAIDRIEGRLLDDSS